MSSELDVERLSAYLDGALPEAEREAVETHLTACAACRARLQTLRAVKHALARLPSCEEPPGAVRAHVEGLRFPQAARKHRRRFFGLLAAAVPLMAAAAVLYVMSPVTPVPHELTNELVVDHLKSVPEVRPAEVASQDPHEVIQFFAGHVPFRPIAPVLPGARLVGGRLCSIAGERGQLLFYRANAEAGSTEQTLSLFVSGAPFETQGCRATRGHHVCGRTVGRLKLVLVGKLPEARLSRLLEKAAL
ncbi:MAG: anti-sigma factor family protein [Vicinamibacteraceae bacterium]